MLTFATQTRTFQTQTSLLEHQREAVAKLLPARVGALFAEMGTGKSRIAIELARLRHRKIDRVVWFCPVSLKDTVRFEILKHTDCTDSDIYVFSDSTTERKLPLDRLWYIIGIESMSSSTRSIFSAHRLISEHTLVIADESTYIKGPDALRTQRMTKLAEPARYRLIMTGTPFSQGVVDLYAQMRFLDPRILGYRSFYSFARNHLEYSEKYPGVIVKAHNVTYLAAKIRPYVYQVTKAECLTLPAKLYETRMCSLTWQQQDAYAEAKRELLEAVEPDDWDSIFIFRLFTALQGIVCGFWTRPNRTTVELEHNRLALLLRTLHEVSAPEKVVIWTRYHHSIRQIVEALTSHHGPELVAQIHGKLSVTQRNQEIARWRDSARFLVATEGVGGHGLTLIEARYIVFYMNGFKYSGRLQAEDRCHRIGQERQPVYIDLRSWSGIEDRIFSALDRKGNALREFRQQVDKIKKQGTKDKLRQLVKSL